MVTGGEGGANTDGERKREAITIMMHEPRPQPREVQPFRGARLARMLGRHIARRMGCGVGGLGGVVVCRMMAATRMAEDVKDITLGMRG
jgi:hypothetical protein